MKPHSFSAIDPKANRDEGDPRQVYEDVLAVEMASTVAVPSDGLTTNEWIDNEIATKMNREALKRQADACGTEVLGTIQNVAAGIAR